MASASASEAARIQQEIALLTGAINRHKSGSITQQSTGYSAARTRNSTYVNPNYKPPTTQYKPPTKYVRPATTAYRPQPPPVPSPSQTRDVVIGGVAFESSGRSLVRKDCALSQFSVQSKDLLRAPRNPTSISVPKPATAKAVPSRPTNSHADLSRTKAGHLVPSGRTYKPTSRGRGRRRGRARGRGGPVNMTLDNSRRPYQAGRSGKRIKYLDKPCSRFTTTGACSRGLTCMYQHDASKIAICWNFLQGNCPNNADTCQLSHDPTPQRTPLCVHFGNNGRCTRDQCPFPHVRVGPRHGVCRDFAVLGYCEKGLDCDKQHVRECPDFAENGACTTKGCKLPHVIRANRHRKSATSTSTPLDATSSSVKDVVAADSSAVISGNTAGTDNSSLQHASAEDAQLGDEYISLTFHESESSGDEEEEEEEDGDDEEEGDDPNDDEGE